MLSYLDPPQCQNITLSTIEQIIPVSFEVKLEVREFITDPEIDPGMASDAVQFWLKVLAMQSPMGERKYSHLANLSLQLLSIPASNADSERVFSLVQRIRTEFRASLSTESVSALIGCHFNKNCECCEKSTFDDSLIAKAYTSERNLRY